ENSLARAGKARGEPSGHLPPTAFVFFLQNHDQTGNRAQGDRLEALCGHCPAKLEAAIALQVLTPHIPLFFMGEEYGTTAPFLYFTSFHSADLQACVREGRSREFSGLHHVSGSGALHDIPDPGSLDTWRAAHPVLNEQEADARRRRALYQRLLTVRRRFISPFLAESRALGAQAISDYC